MLDLLGQAQRHLQAIDSIGQQLTAIAEEDPDERALLRATAQELPSITPGSMDRLTRAMDELDAAIDDRRSSFSQRTAKAERDYARDSEERQRRENRWGREHNWTPTKPPETAKA